MDLEINEDNWKDEKKKFGIMIGKIIKDARESSGLTQREITERAGFYRTFIGLIENGKYSPSVFTVWRIVMAYDKKSAKKKILTELESVPVVLGTCSNLGIPRPTFYRWRKEDESFKDQIEKAKEKGRETMCELAESVIMQRIHAGEKWAIVYWLNNNEPRYMKIEKAKLLKENDETISVVRFIGDINDGEPDFPINYSRNEDEEVEFDSFEEVEKAERLRKKLKIPNENL